MRIIAGQWGSRRLHRPRTSDTRPMPDRVKEALFSVLGAYYGYPGELPALQVADVFAGSGSNGLEALSRGAAGCRFFEAAPLALDALRLNLRALKAETAARVVPGDAWRTSVREALAAPFDLLFLDPPYAAARDWNPQSPLARYFVRMAEALNAVNPLLVFHHPAKMAQPDSGDIGWRLIDQRTYGSNAISYFERSG